MRLFRPFRLPEFGGQAAIIPLIAACLAISLVGGALLSVITMSPASAPTLNAPRSSGQPAVPPGDLTELPAGHRPAQRARGAGAVAGDLDDRARPGQLRLRRRNSAASRGRRSRRT